MAYLYTKIMAYRKNSFPNVLSPMITKTFGLRAMKDGQSLPGEANRVLSAHGSLIAIPIGDSGKYVLIDAGMDKKARKLERFMANRGLGIDAVKFVLLTHAHSDHVRGLHALSDDVVVFASKAASKVLDGTMRSDGPIPGMIDRIPRYMSAAVPRVRPEILVDDQVVSLGNLTIRAIESSGHADGHFMYLVSSDPNEPSTLYSGDALDFSRRGDVVNAPRLFSGDTEMSRQSIIDATKRIADSGTIIDTVVPAHSGNGDFQALLAFKKEQQE